MKPTVIGSPSSHEEKMGKRVVLRVPSGISEGANMNPKANFREEASPDDVLQHLRTLNFAAMSASDISTLEHASIVDLHTTLNGFLVRINRLENPKIFRLMDELTQTVKDQDLESLSRRITEEPVSVLQRALGLVSPKALQAAKDGSWKETRKRVVEKTQTLLTVLDQMERNMDKETQALETEIGEMDKLQTAYREYYVKLLGCAQFLRALLEQEKAKMESDGSESRAIGSYQRLEVEETRNKLEVLESRTLAVEGLLALLPTDHAVVQMLKYGAVNTLHEAKVTTSIRFASIKMTLLTIHAALVTRSVQQFGEKGAELDKSLAQVRGHLLKTVVEEAANAPGKNREQQADQLLAIVESVRVIEGVITAARSSNAQKFEQARQKFHQAIGLLVRQNQSKQSVANS